MRIVVSNNAVDYSNGFLKVSTLKDVEKIVGKIRVLVYHKSNEKLDDKVELLTKLKQKVETLIYIRNKEDCEQAVQMIVVGSGGKYVDDEFFLEDDKELNNLIQNLSEMTQLVELGGVNVVTDFFTRYVSEGSSSFNRSYLELVKNAVTGMISDYNTKNLELVRLSETATELFSNSIEILSGVEEERTRLKAAVDSLEKARDEGTLFATMNVPSTSSVYFYPRVSYLKERKILRIKEVGSLPYLTSFMLGFHFFLTKVKYAKAKLIFLYSVGDSYTVQYKNYPWITQDNSKDLSNYHKDTIFVNSPSKDVLTKLLDDSDYDYFVVVDRMKQSPNLHLLNSKGVLRFAVSSKSAMDTAGVKPTVSFSGTKITGAMFTLKEIRDYPSETIQRQRVYLREFQSSYNMLFTAK